MNLSSKDDLIAALRGQVRTSVETMEKALAASHEDATGEQTKSDGKYDTRAIEAAYLAQAQQDQLAAARTTLDRLEKFQPEAFAYDAAIEVGALVETESDEGLAFYLLAPAGGGMEATYLGCPVTVVTPESTLFQALLEKTPGTTLTFPRLEITGVE